MSIEHPPADVVERARDALLTEPRVQVAYLFGSFARGSAKRGSDLDIAVLFAERIDARLGGPLDGLRDAIERACHTPCDLIDARAASADLFHRVLRDGQLLVERDRSMRIAFEIVRRNEYFDLLPYLRQYRRHRTA